MYTRAEIWVLRWDIDFNLPATASQVKGLPSLHVSVKDDYLAGALAAEFSQRTRSECGDSMCQGNDLRFVAEFTGDGGCAKTFVADNGHLIDLGEKRIGEIDDAFRARFQLLVP